MGQDVEGRRIRAAIDGLDPRHDLFGRGLRIFDEDIEVAILPEDARVEQFELRAVALPPLVFCHQRFVGKGGLRILVQELHVGVRGRIIEVVVILLHVLAVIALRRDDSEQAFLEDRIPLVPEGGGEGQELVAVADACDPVLAPAIGLCRRPVEGEVGPGIAVRAVVLADGAPSPIRDVGSPPPPGGRVVANLRQSFLFRGCHWRLANVLKYEFVRLPS